MAVSLYETRTMLQALEQMYPPQMNLTKMFFPTVETFETEYVDMDVVKGGRKLAPMVRPTSQAHVVDRMGYTTKSLKAPYIKEKMKIEPNDLLLNRQAGSTIYMGNSNPLQRAQQQLSKDMLYLTDMINRRVEWMAAQLLAAGKFTLTGEYEGYEVDFGMDADHIANASVMWDQATGVPYDDLFGWCEAQAKKSGIPPDRLILGGSVVMKFIFNAQIIAAMDKLRIMLGQINPDAVTGFIGTLRLGPYSLDVYTFSDWYEDEVNGVVTPYVPAKKVFLGSTKAKASQRYGAIKDMRALQPGNEGMPVLYKTQYFPKTYFEEDPSVMWLMLQSAPVLCLSQIDAFGCYTVLA